ncbi:MAG TPA: dihydrofolate reductase family protein [Bacillota bacterium]|nr:dihydrofolate reductase family protein [Bacillota bacterium]
MSTLTAFEWVSLDGVFDADFMDIWWEPYDSTARQKVIVETYNQADAFLMGKDTYDFLAPAWSQLPDAAMGGVAGKLAHTPKFIVSDSDLAAGWGDQTKLDGDAIKEVKKLKKEFGQVTIIGSAVLAKSLAEAGLIDGYKLLINPAIVGSGRRFFADGMQTGLKLDVVRKIDHGVLEVAYSIAK